MNNINWSDVITVASYAPALFALSLLIGTIRDIKNIPKMNDIEGCYFTCGIFLIPVLLWISYCMYT